MKTHKEIAADIGVFIDETADDMLDGMLDGALSAMKTIPDGGFPAPDYVDGECEEVSDED